MSRVRAKLLRGCAGVTGLVLATVTAASSQSASAATVTQTINIPSTAGHLLVTYRGNGHGHGLSQYGALGAAQKGLQYPAILFFYYPKTVLKQVSTSATIRVRLSNTGSATTIAAESNTGLTGVTGPLPTTGIAKYRLVANAASGLTLQKLPSTAGATWQVVKTGVANNAEFRRTSGASIRLYLADGTSTRYFGALRSVRVSSTGATGGVRTVNRLSYDRYTQGVVPNEMPASWDRAATDAQAVAARTYGDYMVHNPMGSSYDICDTTSCQVYGGHIHYAKDGTVLWRDFPRAATDTSLQILNYSGGPVFAQFSAANGGWTVAGSQPYLVAKQDPYDLLTDPYINKTETVTTKSVATAFGLSKVTKLVLTRDGHGTWGGRVLEVSAFNGTTHVDRDGSVLQNALGLGTSWFNLTPTT